MNRPAKIAIALSTINIIAFTIFELSINLPILGENLLLGYEWSLGGVAIFTLFATMFFLAGGPTKKSDKQHPNRVIAFYGSMIGYLLSAIPVGIILALAPYSLSMIGFWIWEISFGVSGLVDFGAIMVWVFEGY